MPKRHPLTLARLLCLLFVALVLHANAAGNSEQLVDDQEVHVVRSGGKFTVDLVAHAPVNQELAWAVLTDFEHMASFLGNLTSSQVLERKQDYLKVRQTGRARYGVFSSEFNTEREIFLTPMREVRAHGTGGNIKSMESLMRLEPQAEGVQIKYHAEVEPDFWMPPLVGPAFVRHETAEQFSSMIREMLRRNEAAHSR